MKHEGRRVAPKSKTVRDLIATGHLSQTQRGEDKVADSTLGFIERMNALTAQVQGMVRMQTLAAAIILIRQQPEEAVRDSLILTIASESYRMGLRDGWADAKGRED